MKGSTQAGLVLAVGYVLGRRRKLRTATLMAAAAATGGAGSLGAAAFRRGLKMLDSSEALGDLGPQLSEIAGTMRGDLAEAGKAAVLASVTNRISSLSDSLQDRVEAARNPAAGAADAAGQAEDSVRDQGRRARRGPGRQEREPDNREPEDQYQDEDDDDREPEDQYQDEDDDDRDDEYQDEDDAPPARRRAARKSPVSRTRR